MSEQPAEANVQHIDAIDDPRVASYRDMPERELAASGGLFVAEGEHLVRRLIASDFPVESLLLAERRVEAVAPLAPPGVPIYALPDALMNQVLGFKFHSGVMALGRRKAAPKLEDVVPRDRPCLLMICPEILNTENLGGLIRIAAGFGADAMIVGERSCDPFFRRCIRVSMGTIFHLPIIHTDDLLRDITRLKGEFGVTMVATVVEPDAEPLETVARPERMALLMGSESQGLHRRWLAVSDRRVTIPMHLGTDSLNVAVAAAVFLYHFTRGNQR